MKFCKNLLRVIDLSDPSWGPFWMEYKLLKVGSTAKQGSLGGNGKNSHPFLVDDVKDFDVLSCPAYLALTLSFNSRKQ